MTDVRRGIIGAGVLGFGFSALIDVVVLHLILQLHHLVSNRYPISTVPGLRTNVFADGVFSLGAIVVMGVGAGLLWRAERRAAAPLPAQSLAGAALIGIGGFDVFDVVVDHYLLGIHHATHGPGNYDPHWLVLSALLVVAGVLVYRGGDHAGGTEA